MHDAPLSPPPERSFAGDDGQPALPLRLRRAADGADLEPPSPPMSGFQPGLLPSTSAVMNACPNPMVLIDGSGRVTFANQAFADLAGQPGPSLVTRSVFELLPVEVGVAAMSDLSARSRVPASIHVPEQVLVDQLGTRRRVTWAVTAVPADGADPPMLLATGVDVTLERNREAAWRSRAETDPLTGLPNRVAAMDVLSSCLDASRGTGCGLLFCDLDGFKAVNDSHGHAVGDHVLVEVARRIRSAVRPDDVVGRLGGDEFVVILPGAGAIDMRAITPRIEKAVNRAIAHGGLALRVGVSIGMRIADPGEEPHAVLDDADAAMYTRKALRRRQRGQARP